MSNYTSRQMAADLHGLAERLAAREDAAAEHPGAIKAFREMRPADIADGGKGFKGMMDYLADVAYDKGMGELADTARDLLDRLKEYSRHNHTIYRYYSTQRPVDIGTFPKTPHGPVRFKNFDEHKPVEGGAFRAWGVLLYNAPLTQKQMDDYELRPAPDNLRKITAEELEAQVQVVGKWEQEKHVPDSSRQTWWYPDFGVFVLKEHVTVEQLAERHGKVVAHQSRAGRRQPTIEQRLAQAKREADRENAARPAPKKEKDKDSR